MFKAAMEGGQIKGRSIDRLERQPWRQAVGREGDVTWKLQEKGDWNCETKLHGELIVFWSS